MSAFKSPIPVGMIASKLLHELVYYPRMAPKTYSHERFVAARRATQTLYSDIFNGGSLVPSEWVHPFWEAQRKPIEAYLKSDFPENFIYSPVLRWMVSRGLGRDVMLYREIHLKNSDEPLRTFLKSFCDSKVGKPQVESRQFLCSANTLYHLFYLSRLFAHSKELADGKPKTIVEFGGGYGNLARILRTFLPNVTYIIVDLPEIVCFQYLFLRLNFAELDIPVHYRGEISIAPGTFNLVPLPNLKELNIDSSDLFISTFALTETSVPLQAHVAKNNFYNARSAYITGSYHEQWNRLKSVALFKDAFPNFALKDMEVPKRYEFMGMR